LQIRSEDIALIWPCPKDKILKQDVWNIEDVCEILPCKHPYTDEELEGFPFSEDIDANSFFLTLHKLNDLVKKDYDEYTYNFGTYHDLRIVPKLPQINFSSLSKLEIDRELMKVECFSYVDEREPECVEHCQLFTECQKDRYKDMVSLSKIIIKNENLKKEAENEDKLVEATQEVWKVGEIRSWDPAGAWVATWGEAVEIPEFEE
jgi:hypothetical protein